MKELSKEEKAKRYDEVIPQLKGLLDGIREEKCDIMEEDIIRIFPEVKESEDEEIRKTIYNCVKWFGFDSCFFKDVSQEECLAWLEKQGERKPPEYTLEQAAGIFLDALSNTPYNNKPITDAQVITKELLKFLEDTSSYNPNAINEQKPVWSEEDEKMLETAISSINQESVMEGLKSSGISYSIDSSARLMKNLIDWLKSLKERVQPKNTWKPSDGQMIVLNDIIINGHLSNANERILKGLHEQLKKLREE